MTTKTPGNAGAAPDLSEFAHEYPYPEAVECPYPVFQKLRALSSVHKIPGQEMYFLAQRDDVIFSLERPDIFSNLSRNPGTPLEAKTMKSGIEVRTLLDSDPPTQAQHKQFLLKHFNPKVFRDQAPAIRALVDELIDGFIDDGKCDFVQQFGNRLPEHVIAKLLELPRDVSSNFTEWGRLETSGVRFFSSERLVRQEKVLASLAAYSEQIVIERHKNLGDDMLSNFIKAQIERDGEFVPDYTKLTVAVLITAGLLTTAVMLAQGMRLLLDNPDQMKKVIADPTLIPNMVDEILRIESPAQWIPKRVGKDHEMHGTKMPAGSHVCVGLASANRDETVYPDADKFDVTRGNASSHLAFGKGIHFCVGAPLARLEGQIAFERLLTRLTNIRLSPDNDFKHIDSPSFRALKKLNIEFEKA